MVTTLWWFTADKISQQGSIFWRNQDIHQYYRRSIDDKQQIVTVDGAMSHKMDATIYTNKILHTYICYTFQTSHMAEDTSVPKLPSESSEKTIESNLQLI